ncbi:MAG: PAS domain S-box protein [Anaerolineae bacterium]|nr:PAS domain S-box protein [Anaerolineae bacterium]
MNKLWRIHWRDLVLGILSILLGALLSRSFWRHGDQELRAEYLLQAQRVAQAVDLEEFRALSGSPDDQERPEYKRLKQQLMLTRRTYPESRFLYLMGRNPSGEIFFYIDSEPPGSPDESPPGQIFTDATDTLERVFSEGSAAVEGPVVDDWGVWVSALAPLLDPDDGRVIAVFGMDVEAASWNRLILERVILPVALSILLVVSLLAGGLYLHHRFRLRPGWLDAHAELYLTLALGLMITGLAAWVAHDGEKQSRKETFEQLAAASTGYLSAYMRDLENFRLRGLADFFEASQFVDFREFLTYTTSLARDHKVQAWEWVPVVPARERLQFEENAHQDGLAGFVIWELNAQEQRIPAQEREVYYPILYISPLQGNEAAIGYDLASEPVRRVALEVADSSGLTTATDPILLVQETENQMGILTAWPVYGSDAPGSQRGFVLAALRMGDLLHSALGIRSDFEPVLFVDFYQLQENGLPLLLASNAPQEIVQRHIQGELHDHPYGGDLTFSQPFFAFGKAYMMLAHPSPAFARLYPVRAREIALLVGVVITILLGFSINAFVNRQNILEKLVAARTAELQESEEQYRQLFEAESDAIFLIDNEEGRILQANQAACALYGYSRDELLALCNTDLSAEPEQTRKATRENEPDPSRVVAIPLRWHKKKDGTVFPVEIAARLFVYKGRPVHIAAIRDITQRFEAEKTLHLQSSALNSAANAIVITDRQGTIQWINPAFTALTGYPFEEAVGKNPRQLVRSGVHGRKFYRRLWDTILSGRTWRGEITNRRKDGELYDEEMTITPVKSANGEITHFIAIKQNVSERKQRERELEAVAVVSAALRAASTRAEMLPVILDQLTALLNADGAALALRDASNGELSLEASRGEFEKTLRKRLGPGEGLSGAVMKSGTPFVTQDISRESSENWAFVFEVVRAVACIPLIVETQTIGVLWIGRKNPFTPGEIRLMTSVADIAASAIHRETLREETVRQLDRLATLRAIDQVLTSNVDLKVMLKFILGQVASQLKAEAVAVLLLNPRTMELQYAEGRGFRTREIESARVGLGRGAAGQVAAEQKTLLLPDLTVERFWRAPLISKEGFVSYFATPLVVKGQLKGVLEIFQRARFDPEPDWVNYFEMLAGQIAIAIENTQLFENLQRSNTELSLAYDATLEGWSRAMDLRDEGTEGHTRRVTDLTLRLAQMAGMSEEELVHVRRGALLHDIGKLGVPDRILLKPGPLDEAEWAVMHRHPQFAFDMLWPIAFLRSALDIPYCHHEKWDGTGYPRGLKGEQIPLAARIFAVVDVYDALISDRPYRPAWTEEEAFATIREGSGTHFDPEIVKLFFEMMAKRNEA